MTDSTNKSFTLLSNDNNSILPMLLHARLQKDDKKYDELIADFQKHYSTAYIQIQEAKVEQFFKKPKPFYKKMIAITMITICSIFALPAMFLNWFLRDILGRFFEGIHDRFIYWNGCFYKWGIKK